MYSTDTNPFFTLLCIDEKPTVMGQREFVLRDLKAFGKIGIEVVLSSENTCLGDFTIQGQSDTKGKFNGTLVDDRQSPRDAGTDFADRRVCFRTGGIDNFTAAEHFGC